MVTLSEKQQKAARNAVNNAIRNGTLQRPLHCVHCKNKNKRILAHHPDYNKSLEIMWLCPKCHAKEHRRISPETRSLLYNAPTLTSSSFVQSGLLAENTVTDEHKYGRDTIDWNKHLSKLTYRQREIIKLRYGFGDGFIYTLEEVAKIFKVTRERVRQVEQKAIRRLKMMVA